MKKYGQVLEIKHYVLMKHWPLEDVIKKSEIKIAVQINGKTKEIIEIDESFQKKKF